MEKKYIDQNCPYCSISEGKKNINTDIVLYKDDFVTAFLYHMPVNPGHVLVISNAHYSNPSSLTDTQAGRMYYLAIRIGVALKRSLDSSGYNIITSDGFCAGQDIQHASIHVIPRFLDDGWNLNWRGLKIENMSLLAKKISSTLKV